MTESLLKLRIVTPEETVEAAAEAVWLPGFEGPFTVLPSHAPLVAALVEGSLRWRKNSEEREIPVRGGSVLVENDVVTVCAERR